MRGLIAAVMAVLLLVGCTGGAADPTPTPTPEPSPTATPTPVPTPTMPPLPEETAPLTGLPTRDPQLQTRPVLALKIDNHPLARPQTALVDADIVIEQLVEGGVTRFIALYHSQLPPEVGPIRSAREVDADLLPAFQPLLGMSGAAPMVWGLLRGAGLTVYEEGQVDGFFRRPDLPRPHNLFARPAELLRAGEHLPPASIPWEIDEATPPGGTPATAAHVRLSPFADADWTWDPLNGRWVRDEDGASHMDATGARQSAETVVVAEVVTRPGGRTDAGGNRTVEIDVLGEGPATILRDGRAYEARWRKDTPGTQFLWTTPDGDPLAVAPGRTWIELMPETGTLEYS